MSGSSLAALLAGAQPEAMVPGPDEVPDPHYLQPDWLRRQHPETAAVDAALLRHEALRVSVQVRIGRRGAGGGVARTCAARADKGGGSGGGGPRPVACTRLRPTRHPSTPTDPFLMRCFCLQEAIEPLWDQPLSCVAACSLGERLHVLSAAGQARTAVAWTDLPLQGLYAGRGVRGA